MEPCKEHSGIVAKIDSLCEKIDFQNEHMEKLTDSIINMKVETAKTSAKVGARVGVKWASIGTGVILGIYKIAELLISRLEAMPK